MTPKELKNIKEAYAAGHDNPDWLPALIKEAERLHGIDERYRVLLRFDMSLRELQALKD